MKKLLFELLAVIIMAAGLLAPVPAFADDACSVAGYNDPLICGTPDSDEETALQNRIKNILNTVYLWVGIIAVIVIVIGGVKYMTSTGEADKIKGAKNAVTYSVVGLVVTLAAFAITNFFIGALDGKTPEEVAAGPAAPAEDREAVKSIAMLNSTRMTVGDKAKMRAKVLPDYAKDKAITWSTNNVTIASVDNDGNVEAKSEGKVNITATAKNGVSATTAITVLKPIEVAEIRLSSASVKVNKGKTVSVKARVVPYNATNKTLTWKSADEKIAHVNSEGEITGKKEGKTTVTVSASNGKTASVSVEVVDPSAAHAIKITSQLTNSLRYYHQTNYMENNSSCRSRYGGVTCGLSSYLALVKILTGKDHDYPTFTEESCGMGFFNGNGATWEVVSMQKKSFYESKYGITGKIIPNTWDSIVSELKKGHPMAIIVRGLGGFRGTDGDGMHYVVLISYRPNNGGEIYAWNPVVDPARLGGQEDGGWVSKDNILKYAIGRGASATLPWAAWKK